MRILRITGCAIALAAFLTPSAFAQTNEATKLTYMTFSGPVQVPFATLPAGTYTFKMADPSTSSHVVQVLSRDGKKVFAQFFAIPNERPDATDDTVVMFAERPAGQPQAAKVWYYPGRKTGEEFIYPKRQALAIAKANHTTVLSSDSDTKSASPTVARIDENGAAKASTAAESTVAEARPAQAPAVGTAGQEGAPAAPARRRSALPRTGSDLSLVALLSGLALAGALGTRRARKHLAIGN